jgi:hypothetical protein
MICPICNKEMSLNKINKNFSCSGPVGNSIKHEIYYTNDKTWGANMYRLKFEEKTYYISIVFCDNKSKFYLDNYDGNCEPFEISIPKCQFQTAHINLIKYFTTF